MARTVRTSERTTFGSCVQKWYWAYIDRLKPRQQAVALTFGTVVHEALATYYPPGIVRGPAPAETFIKVMDELGIDLNMRNDDDAHVSGREMGVAMLNGYVKHWGRDDDFEIIAPEMDFRVAMYTDDDEHLADYVGTMDAMMRLRRDGRLGILEHKTAKSISFAHIFLDEQVSSYWALAPYFLNQQGIIGPDQWLDFVFYNVLRKALPDPRPRNAQGLYLNKPTKANPEGEVSKRQPKPLFERRTITRGHAEIDNLFARTSIQVQHMNYYEQNPDMVYKSPGKDCSWCPFRDMCELHETGNDWESFRDATMVTWNPYDAHEPADPSKKVNLTVAGTRKGGWTITDED